MRSSNCRSGNRPASEVSRASDTSIWMGNGSKKSKSNSAAGKIPMSDVTHILSAIEQGDPQAAKQLLPLVYDELRKLAAQNLAQEKSGQTLDATGLVHEAYL